MGRKKLILDSNASYHVTARSNNRDWFSIPMDTCWQTFEDLLATTAERYNLLIHSFVLMSNHFHLILSTPSMNLDKGMRYFMTETSREIARASGRINHIYGARYKWSWLSSNQSLAYAYKYVYRNPVRAGICDAVEKYPYSTITSSLHNSYRIPICERIDWKYLPPAHDDRLVWLNTPTLKDEQMISLALRRHTFAFSRDKKVQLRLKKLSNQYLPKSMV